MKIGVITEAMKVRFLAFHSDFGGNLYRDTNAL